MSQNNDTLSIEKNLSETTSDKTPVTLSTLAITLLKGVIYRNEEERLWGDMLRLQNQLRDYVAVLGLRLIIDHAEGYAYLRSTPETEDGDTTLTNTIPRLIARRPLSFHVSLLLALLRQQLVRFDALGGETQLMLSREDITSLLQTFLPETTNEVRQLGMIDSYIKRVVELGFLRPLAGEGQEAPSGPHLYEVRRILKAYIDAEWLATLDERLEAYLAHARTLEQPEHTLFATTEPEENTPSDATLFTPPGQQD